MEYDRCIFDRGNRKSNGEGYDIFVSFAAPALSSIVGWCLPTCVANVLHSILELFHPCPLAAFIFVSPPPRLDQRSPHAPARIHKGQHAAGDEDRGASKKISNRRITPAPSATRSGQRRDASRGGCTRQRQRCRTKLSLEGSTGCGLCYSDDDRHVPY